MVRADDFCGRNLESLTGHDRSLEVVDREGDGQNLLCGKSTRIAQECFDPAGSHKQGYVLRPDGG